MEMPSGQLWALSSLNSKAHSYKAPWGHNTHPICGQGFGASSKILWDQGWELCRNWAVLAELFIEFYWEKLNISLLDEVNSKANCGILKAEIRRCHLEVLTQVHIQAKDGNRFHINLYQLLRHKYPDWVSLGCQVSSVSCVWITLSFL